MKRELSFERERGTPKVWRNRSRSPPANRPEAIRWLAVRRFVAASGFAPREFTEDVSSQNGRRTYDGARQGSHHAAKADVRSRQVQTRNRRPRSERP